MKKNKRISFLLIIIILLPMVLSVVDASTTQTKNTTTNNTVEQSSNQPNNTTVESKKEEQSEEQTTKENSNSSNTVNQTDKTKEETQSKENDNKQKEVQQEEDIMTMSLERSATQSLANGMYTIKSALNTKKVLDIAGGSSNNGANVQIYEQNDTNAQKFNITYLGDGYYTIQSVQSNKVLDVAGAEKTNGTNVQQYTSNHSDAQKWLIKEVKTGYYSIVSKCNNLCLDVSGGVAQNATNIQVYKENGTRAQLFTFEKTELPKQTIANGTYTIKTALNTKRVLDIAGGSSNNGANVQLYTDNYTNAQKFNITYLGDGYYTIQSVQTKKVLDVAGAGKTSGTNVQQYASNHSDSQKWMIKEVQKGYYAIISKCNGLYLDVAGGKTNNGTNVQMYKRNGTKSQLFVFEKTEELKQTIKDGMYKIKSAKDSKKVLTVSKGNKANSANVEISTDTNSKYQKFHIVYLGSGYYSIRAVHTKASLDVAGASTAKGANVQQYTYNGSNAQKWIIKDIGNGKYSIISKCNNLYLDINGGLTTDGTNIQMYTGNSSEAQQFTFEATSAQAIENGVYEIQTALSTKKVIDVSGGSLANGANVQIWDRANVNQQKFQVTYGKDGYYTIEAIHSNKVLDVAGAGTKNATNVQQYAGNSSNAQKWKIEDLGNGYYNIISKCNNLYIDVAGGKTNNGTNIQMYGKNGTASQKFSFIETGIYDFATINEIQYPGYKALLQQIQNQHPNWTINVHYTGLNWNEVIRQEDQIISGSPRSLVYDTYKNQWINGTTKYDVSGRWYRASQKAIAYMMDPRNSLTDTWIFQFQDLSSSSGTKEEISKMVSGTFLNNSSVINSIVATAQEQKISPFHLVSRILQEQGSDGKGIMNGNYTYLRKKSI